MIYAAAETGSAGSEICLVERLIKSKSSKADLAALSWSILDSYNALIENIFLIMLARIWIYPSSVIQLRTSPFWVSEYPSQRNSRNHLPFSLLRTRLTFTSLGKWAVTIWVSIGVVLVIYPKLKASLLGLIIRYPSFVLSTSSCSSRRLRVLDRISWWKRSFLRRPWKEYVLLAVYNQALSHQHQISAFADYGTHSLYFQSWLLTRPIYWLSPLVSKARGC